MVVSENVHTSPIESVSIPKEGLKRHVVAYFISLNHIFHRSHFSFFFSAMFSRIMSSGSQFVMEGVKNLVVGNKVLYNTLTSSGLPVVKS